MSPKDNDTKQETPGPKKDPRIAINMRLPSKLLKKLKEEGILNNRSATSIIVEMLHDRYRD